MYRRTTHFSSVRDMTEVTEIGL